MQDIQSILIGDWVLFFGIMIGVMIVSLSVLYWRQGNSITFRIVANALLLGIYGGTITMTVMTVHILAPGLYLLSLILGVVIAFVIIGFISYFMLSTIIKPLNEISRCSKKIAQGELTVKLVKYTRKDDIGILVSSFQEMIEFLAPKVMKITSIAETLASSAQEMASGAEEVNASSEEISSITQQMSRGAQQQTDQINIAVKQTDDVKSEFNDQIKGISAASDLVETISSQVNMLALNASIEAARAGEYGRGFAVVADNIRRLADETKQSLVGVNQTLEQLNLSVGSLINAITTSVQNVASISEETAAGAEEASAATEEQAATMEEMSASAQELAVIATNLKRLTNQFAI